MRTKIKQCKNKLERGESKTDENVFINVTILAQKHQMKCNFSIRSVMTSVHTVECVCAGKDIMHQPLTFAHRDTLTINVNQAMHL